jgi:hypothetical protein
LIAENPVVGILGPRQVGKTTLAREITHDRWRATTTFDYLPAAWLVRSPPRRPRRPKPGQGAERQRGGRDSLRAPRARRQPV